MNKTHPKITIIVANYNGTNYIKACLNSVLKSSYKNFEIIVVDDGSKDNSKSVLKSFEKEKKIKIFYFKKNKGAACARNFGVKRSKGEYILFIDFDCEIEKKCLAAIIKKLNKDKEIGGIVLKLITDNGKLDSAGHFYSIFGFPYEVGAGENPENYQKELPVFGSKTAGFAVRKDVIEKIHGFDEDYVISGEDTDLSWRIILANYQLIYFPEAIGYHHQKETEVKSTKYRILYEGIKNNLCNLIKNSSVSLLWWIIPLHIFSLLLLSLKLLIQGRINDSLWIYKSILWNIIHLNKTLEKRKLNKIFAKNDNIVNMFGSINHLQLMKKGWKWFLNV
ncbi:MAG: glycosyltransferase family 2 protein [Candidatus Roizmanbacteria bacterium]|nr:MAG: glycosyltransferase family 2 protein [Candidatus Roizmanbacteria bacterium]